MVGPEINHYSATIHEKQTKLFRKGVETKMKRFKKLLPIALTVILLLMLLPATLVYAAGSLTSVYAELDNTTASAENVVHTIQFTTATATDVDKIKITATDFT